MEAFKATIALNSKGLLRKGRERKIGVLGFGPGKIFRATPSRMSKSAHLEHGTKSAIIIDLCAQKENWSFNLETKEQQLR